MRRALPAFLLAAALGGGCSRPPILPETPSTLVSPSALTFTAPGAGYDPVPQTLSVFSPEGGPLVVTRLSTTYASASGWLSAQVVDAAGSPARIAVQTHVAGLASGTYEATLYVHAEGVVDSPRPVHVTFVVPNPRAVASAASLIFVAPVGGADPPPQQVVVTNAGGGTLGRPVVTAPSWISAWVTGSGDPYTVVLQPRVEPFTQLGGVVENVKIWAQGAGNTLEVPVELSLEQPQLETSPSSVAFGFQPGTVPPAAKDVAVSVRTPARVAASTPTMSVSYSGTTGIDWLSVQLVGVGPTYTLRLQPKGAVLATMAVGFYQAYVWLYTWGGAARSVNVRLVVSSNVASIVTPSPASVPQRWLRGWYAVPQNVVDVGDGLGGTLAQPTASVSYAPGPVGWLFAGITGSGAPWKLAVQPFASSALATGHYDAAVNLVAMGATTGTVAVGLDVEDWQAASFLEHTVRGNHTATVLADGKVLVVGGPFYDSSVRGEIWDPATRSFLPGGALVSGRFDHTATLLPNGRVVVAGGARPCSISSSCEVPLQTWEMYEPATGTWRVLRSLVLPRRGHVAAALPDGNVLVAGGGSSDAVHTPTASAEIIDTVLTASSQAPPMGIARRDASAVALPDGRVLVAGGIDASGYPTATAEIFDASSGRWTPTGTMATPRARAALVLLGDGRVLVAGGSDGAAALASAEVYDPAAGTWSVTGSMAVARVAPAVLLPSGAVLVVAGLTGDLSAPTATVETWDAATGIWSRAGDLPKARSGDAIAVAGGLVFVSGRTVEGNASQSATLVGTGAPR